MLFVKETNYFYNSSCPLNFTMLIVDFISQALEMLSDLYMGFKFVTHFLFFMTIKRLKLRQMGQ